MEEKVDRKIQEMLEQEIIEPVTGPPEWISPMVVVPKGKDDIRLCINMRYPNQAIQREHYPLPMIDTLLNKLKGAKYFSKLDITSAFYHIELHHQSRGITTFMTSRGLMRFRRLMFGINCAPEIFQRSPIGIEMKQLKMKMRLKSRKANYTLTGKDVQNRLPSQSATKL
uniref:Reverse transcriptase domain-containing protein n=1 Tax=Anopheles dirus TaxID=7168 RepID=A0A182NV09_9DIPT